MQTVICERVHENCTSPDSIPEHVSKLGKCGCRLHSTITYVSVGGQDIRQRLGGVCPALRLDHPSAACPLVWPRGSLALPVVCLL
jgi:hypothetical protein